MLLAFENADLEVVASVDLLAIAFDETIGNSKAQLFSCTYSFNMQSIDNLCISRQNLISKTHLPATKCPAFARIATPAKIKSH